MEIACLVSANPYLDFARALALFYQPPRPAPGIHPMAYVAPTATIGENCSIGPFAVVGERVRIGRNAVLHPHVVIYEGAEIGDDFLAHSHAAVREFCRVGDRVTLQNGVVVGGDGFGFAKRADGTQFKIVQSGVTVLEDDVEIQIADFDRPRHGGRDPRQARRQDRQPGAGGARLHGRRGQHHLRADRPGGQHGAGAQCGAGRAGGVERALTVHEGAVVYAQSGIGGDVAKRARGSPDRRHSRRASGCARSRRFPSCRNC